MIRAEERFAYAVALGSNRRHGHHGPPAQVIAAAVAAMHDAGVVVLRASPVVRTAAFGPAGRSFANAAAVIETMLTPPELLRLLKQVERGFGRRAGRRWGPRVIDLDIILWSGGVWRQRGLQVPHAAFATRAFVLDPLVHVAPAWRAPRSGLTVRQLRARLRKPRMVDRKHRQP